MTAPVPVSCLYLAKLIQVAKMTLMTQVWVGVLFFICGKYAGFPDCRRSQIPDLAAAGNPGAAWPLPRCS